MSIVETSDDASRGLRPIAAPRYRSWSEAVKDAVRDPGELCRLVQLPPRYAVPAAARDFPVFAPKGYIARMRPADVRDPLLRQVLPLEDELDQREGFGPDPVGDRAATKTPGLLHKYRSRVLMVATGACAVHCRYCFRRHFPYWEGPRSVGEWADELLALLRSTRLTPIVVIHANHAQELEGSVVDALGRLSDAGIPLLNQSVLLRGVNDDIEALAALCERLVDLRVMPYYLHQLDRVAGAAHFEVSESRGRKLVEQLRARLPGYAVPRYVRETPGAASKLILA